MDPSVDALAAIDRLGSVEFEGLCFRWTPPSRTPLSGVGARLTGGRWNPPGISTIYLAQPAEASAAEFLKIANAQPGGPEAFERPLLHTVEVSRLRALDLRREEHLLEVGLTLADVGDEDQADCQEIGHAASYLGLQGVLAPSATGVGIVIAVYDANLQPGQLQHQRSDDLREIMAREYPSLGS